MKEKEKGGREKTGRKEQGKEGKTEERKNGKYLTLFSYWVEKI